MPLKWHTIKRDGGSTEPEELQKCHWSRSNVFSFVGKCFYFTMNLKCKCCHKYCNVLNHFEYSPFKCADFFGITDIGNNDTQTLRKHNFGNKHVKQFGHCNTEALILEHGWETCNSQKHCLFVCSKHVNLFVVTTRNARGLLKKLGQ